MHRMIFCRISDQAIRHTKRKQSKLIFFLIFCHSFSLCVPISILDTDGDLFKAIFSQTTRGKEQLIFCGQPFIYEKRVHLPDGEVKKLWRCNQWWNKRCRARVYTIRGVVTPLNKYHTHEEIIRRKKRIAKKKAIAPIAPMPATGEGVSHFFIIESSNKKRTDDVDDTAFDDHLL